MRRRFHGIDGDFASTDHLGSSLLTSTFELDQEENELDRLEAKVGQLEQQLAYATASIVDSDRSLSRYVGTDYAANIAEDVATLLVSLPRDAISFALGILLNLGMIILLVAGVWLAWQIFDFFPVWKYVVLAPLSAVTYAFGAVIVVWNDVFAEAWDAVNGAICNFKIKIPGVFSAKPFKDTCYTMPTIPIDTGDVFALAKDMLTYKCGDRQLFVTGVEAATTLYRLIATFSSCVIGFDPDRSWVGALIMEASVYDDCKYPDANTIFCAIITFVMICETLLLVVILVEVVHSFYWGTIRQAIALAKDTLRAIFGSLYEKIRRVV